MKFRLDVEVDTSNGRHCKALGGSCCTFLRDDEGGRYQGAPCARFSCGLFNVELKDESDLPLRNAECRAAEAKAVIDEKTAELVAKAEAAVEAFDSAPQGDMSAARETVRDALADLAQVAGYDYPEAVRLRTMMWFLDGEYDG